MIWFEFLGQQMYILGQAYRFDTILDDTIDIDGTGGLMV